MKDIKKLRAALREKYGTRCYQINRRGEVHIYGPAPSSQVVCWWLMGDIRTAFWWMGIDA
jgi:hypothetical protein